MARPSLAKPHLHIQLKPKMSAVARAVDALRNTGMLERDRLAVTTEAQLPKLAKLALGNRWTAASEAELMVVIREHWAGAKESFELSLPSRIHEVKLDTYRHSLDRIEQSTNAAFAVAQATIREKKVAMQPSAVWSGSSSKKSRGEATTRKVDEESLRESWAMKSKDALTRLGLTA